MMEALVLNAFQRYVDINARDKKLILDRWSEFRFPKHSIISMAGNVEKRFYIVGSGVQKIMFEHEARSHCLGFAYNGSWCGDYISFVSQRASKLQVEALSDSVLYGIAYPDLMDLYKCVPILERWGRLILEELLQGRAQREIEMLSLNAEDRYVKFMERSSHVLQLVPQKDIASYLGMTPESFSRLRAKMS
ncbi:MAG: Crp/Fnr family transcriptional regulator [Flavobacteriales bacterium]|nr:Crp/Fnr family transcriptional regulator [Flavobacteriales bacterium]